VVPRERCARLLHDRSIGTLVVFAVTVQLASLPLFLLAQSKHHHATLNVLC
jgi:hypothetical protein